MCKNKRQSNSSLPKTGDHIWSADAIMHIIYLPKLPVAIRRASYIRIRPWRAMQASHSGREAPEQASSVVLVAKALTKSDTGGRVILPRVSVESNLRFLTGFRRAPPAPTAFSGVQPAGDW